MARSSRTYLPFVRWDFIRGSGRDLLIWSQIPLEDETHAGSHRSGRIVRRVARLVVVCYPPTPASPALTISPSPVLTRLLPSSDSKTSPVYEQLSPPMQLLSIWSTSSMTSGWNQNYATSNSGQLARIILAWISRDSIGASVIIVSTRILFGCCKRRRFSNKLHVIFST